MDDVSPSTVVVVGLSTMSLAVCKFLVAGLHREVLLLSDESISEAATNECPVHLVELNNLRSNKQLTDIYYTLRYLSPNNTTVSLTDNWEFYDSATDQKNLIGLVLDVAGAPVPVAGAKAITAPAGSPGCLSLKNQTLRISPRQYLLDLYQELGQSAQFRHLIVPPQVASLQDYVGLFPSARTVINCAIHTGLAPVRNQSLLLQLAHDTLTTSLIHKTQRDQFTRLVPLLEDPRLVLLSGPRQVNDYYSAPRDSDTLALLQRAMTKFPLLLQDVSVMDCKVVFKRCFPDQVGKIWTDTLDGRTTVHVLGFGFNELDSVGGVVEYLRIILDQSLLQSRL